MEYLRQIEEDLSSLGESWKKYAEVKESCDRALLTLKNIRGDCSNNARYCYYAK